MICGKCERANLTAADFYKRNARGAKYSYCKKCFNAYCIERWRNRKRKAVEYKGGICVDCKQPFDYYLFDFHHLDPSEKEFNFSHIKGHSWKTIVKELDKCVLLCCMCHRKREHEIGTEGGI